MGFYLQYEQLRPSFKEAPDDTFWQVYCLINILFIAKSVSVRCLHCLHPILLLCQNEETVCIQYFLLQLTPSLTSGMSWYLANKCLSQIEGDGQLNAVKNTCISIGAALKSFKKRPNHTFLSRHSIPSLGKIFSKLPFLHIFHENYSLSAVVGHSSVQCCS